MQSLSVVFAGTPDFAAEHLRALLASPHRVVGVYTQPDRPAGRGKKLLPGPVKALAEEHGLAVFQPLNLKDPADQQRLAELKPDLMVVVAYGLILPPAVLAIPRLGCINVHASLLPRWRGAAPIQRAIAAGDGSSGITIMEMEAGLDTGPMLATAVCPIADDETGGSLHDKLAQLGPELLLETIEHLAPGAVVAQAQDDAQATYAPKLSKAEAAIDWTSSAAEIDRKVRAFNPFPVAYGELGGERIRIWSGAPVDLESATEFEIRSGSGAAPGRILSASAEGILVACAQGVYRIEELQLPGRKRLPAREVLNSRAALFAPDQQFD
ncbi:MAG: methionyl-tRNA formyltransferase [Porticoccaceae bacterium]